MQISTLLGLWSWHHNQSRKATNSLKREKNADKRANLERSRDRHAGLAEGFADSIDGILAGKTVRGL